MEIQLVVLLVVLFKSDVISGITPLQLSALMAGPPRGQSAALPNLSSMMAAFGKPRGQSAALPNLSSMMAAFGKPRGQSAALPNLSSMMAAFGKPSTGQSGMFSGMGQTSMGQSGMLSGMGQGTGGSSPLGASSLFGGGGGGGGLTGLVTGMGNMLGAKYLIEKNRILLKRYIELYENEGCVDPFDKLPKTMQAMAANNLIKGCSSPQANFTCQMVQARVVPPRMMMLQNQLRNSPMVQGISSANVWKTLSMLGLPGSGRGISGSIPLMALGGAGPLGRTLTKITEMAERQGKLRQRLVPLQCQDIRHQMVPSIRLSICCPGHVTVPDSIQFLAMQDRLQGL